MADREAIRAQLEATRAGFHALVDGLQPDDWSRKSGNKAWTIGQLLSHIADNVGLSAGSIRMARQGKGFNPPRLLRNPMNVWMTRMSARRADPESVREQYDDGHLRLLTTLDELSDDEWSNGARFLGEYQTIEDLLHSVPAHFREHETDIRKGLA